MEPWRWTLYSNANVLYLTFPSTKVCLIFSVPTAVDSLLRVIVKVPKTSAVSKQKIGNWRHTSASSSRYRMVDNLDHASQPMSSVILEECSCTLNLTQMKWCGWLLFIVVHIFVTQTFSFFRNIKSCERWDVIRIYLFLPVDLPI